MAQISAPAQPEAFQDFGESIELFIADHNTIEMPKYSSTNTIVSTSQPEIVNALHQIQVETEVVTKAIEIFYRIHGVRTGRTKAVKGSRKIRLIFYCVFMAYNELNSPVDPSYAADLISLPRNEIEQAFNEYSPTGPMIIEPEKMIPFYINRINLLNVDGTSFDIGVVNHEVCRVIKTCRGTKAGQEWIQNTAAKIVAIVALYFYLSDIRGLEIGQNIRLFERACYLSWACIRRYHEQIVKYYNQ